MSRGAEAVEIVAGGLIVLGAIITVLLIAGILTLHDLQLAYGPYRGLFYLGAVLFIAIGLVVVAAKLWDYFT